METLAFENEVARITYDRNVAVTAWFDAPRAALELREMEKVGKKISAQYKESTALFNVIVSGTPSFNDEVRKEVTRISADDTLYALGSAHVLLVEGFVGSAVRAFLSTALTLARAKTPNKVFADVDGAATWVKGQLEKGPVVWTPGDLVGLVRRTIDQRRK
jgi:hypothetical protein